jgi:hypothetical protein
MFLMRRSKRKTRRREPAGCGANHRSDILWLNDNGSVAIWDNGLPGHVVANAGAITSEWHLA